MTSRTYRTCERIMKAVIDADHVTHVSKSVLVKIIKRVAGGDPRTVKAYLEHLVDFEFLMKQSRVPVYRINLLKLDYAQTRLDEPVHVDKMIVEEKVNVCARV